MPTCFIICPIGDSGTEIRQNADDLRDLIIKPALEPFGFQVDRGDHHASQGKIDSDVIRAVQEADLCIVDISLPNPNVYYELGRRDEMGKPLVLLRSVTGGEIPVDIATCRYVEYDLDSRRGIINAVAQLKAFVEPIVKRGFEASGSGASLVEIAEILKRVERKVDRMSQNNTAPKASDPMPANTENVNPVDLLNLSMRQRNIPMAEKAMDMLSYRLPRMKWLDQVVEQVATLGSIKAGNVLIESVDEFMDNTSSFSDKLEYYTSLITNLTRTDREVEYRELVEKIFRSLEAVSTNEPSASRIRLYNQMNRLYYGVAIETKDPTWLDHAIRALETALEIDDSESFLHYNLSLCLKKRNRPGDLDQAIQQALITIKLDGDKPSDDHLEHVCELMHAVGDPRLSDYLEVLDKVNHIKAQVLRSRWNS